MQRNKRSRWSHWQRHLGYRTPPLIGSYDLTAVASCRLQLPDVTQQPAERRGPIRLRWGVGVAVFTWRVGVAVFTWRVGVAVFTWRVGVAVFTWRVGGAVFTWRVGVAVFTWRVGGAVFTWGVGVAVFTDNMHVLLCVFSVNKNMYTSRCTCSTYIQVVY